MLLSRSILRFARSSAAPAAVAYRPSRAPPPHIIAHRAMGTASPPPAIAAADVHPPSVFDKIVRVTIIDPSGARRTIPAYVGKSLYDACKMNGVDLGPASIGAPQQKVRSDTWTEPLYGEGATSGFDHVLLQGGNEGVGLAEPPHSNEIAMLEKYWDEDEIFPESRLASMVEINDKMDGMVVYVPDRLVDDIP